MNTPRLLLTCLPVLALGVLFATGPSAAQDSGRGDSPQIDLEQAFQAEGLHLDLDAGLCSIPVQVCIRDDLLEYVLVADYGASHESLFSTNVTPSIWNTALVALGGEPARGGRFRAKDPFPTDDELQAGVPPYIVELPEGTPFYAYALWREDGEARMHRLEDLIGNLRTGRAMKRHALRYVGSHMRRPDPAKEAEVFAADMLGNMLSVHFFRQDEEILSTAVVDAVYDTIWVANAWLVPERGVQLQLIVSRKPIDGLPSTVEALLGE